MGVCAHMGRPGHYGGSGAQCYAEQPSANTTLSIALALLLVCLYWGQYNLRGGSL